MTRPASRHRRRLLAAGPCSPHTTPPDAQRFEAHARGLPGIASILRCFARPASTPRYGSYRYAGADSDVRHAVTLDRRAAAEFGSVRRPVAVPLSHRRAGWSPDERLSRVAITPISAKSILQATSCTRTVLMMTLQRKTDYLWRRGGQAPHLRSVPFPRRHRHGSRPAVAADVLRVAACRVPAFDVGGVSAPSASGSPLHVQPTRVVAPR